MRRLILLGLMVVLVLPAAAARRVTVVQLEQSLAEDVNSHRTDADIAHRLADLELTERLTDATLGKFAKSLTLGPRTALVLQLLADQSAFFEPPARELPATENPDAASQQRMMDLARGYVVRIWPHLPDFFVTRTTVRFDDGPQVLRQGDWPVRAGMHLVGSTTRNLTYRDGQEIVDADTAGSAPLDAASKDAATKTNAALNESSGQQERGMTSRGEFGPELTIVLTDTAKGSVTWSHWEETAAGLAAVYNYSVPKAASHFEVSYCCLREDAPSQRRELQYGNHGRSAPDKVAVAPAAAKLFHTTPGYHGTLAIDPTTGAILRVTLEAEFKGDEPISRAATMVQYGPVMIGDQRYIFPVRSLALSTEQPAFTGHVQDPPTLLINQTLFTHYHRLAATIRMLSDAEANAMPAAAPPATGANTPPAGSALASPVPPSTTPAAAPAPETTAAAEPPAPAAAAPPAEPAVPEISVTAASGVPDEPANSAQPQASDFQLKLSSRLVDVGVVAWDKKGHPVTDLKAEDIEIYDNGHKQDLRFFTQFSSGAAPSAAANTPKDTLSTNRTLPGPTCPTPTSRFSNSLPRWPQRSA
ncbi:MAG: hypothetical protein ABSF53_20415 [Terracidiphilus sp.]